MLALLAHRSPKYPPRTFENAGRADLTAAFALDFATAGERLTKKAAGAAYVALPLQPAAAQADPLVLARVLFSALKATGAARPILNVAGNGIYSLAHAGWTQPRLNAFLRDVLAPVHAHLPLSQIVSGGQTGVDWAAGVAGHALGIPVEMTLPAGFIQRGLDGVDAPRDVRALRAQVLDEAQALILSTAGPA